MILLSKKAIESCYSMSECLLAVKEAFSLFSKGEVTVPLRTQIKNKEGTGTYLCMPAYCGKYEASCVKILNLFPGNSQKGIPTINAQVLVFDADTGMMDGMLDGTYITQLRTGAASGIALNILAKKDCKIGALIGTGGQAKTQLEAMLIVRNLKEVRVAGLDFNQTKKFVNQMKAIFAEYSAEIIAVENANDAIKDADLIITATTSTKPVFDGAKIKAGATISGVGSYQPNMQEIPTEVLIRASKIYFDSEEAVLAEAGDILIPLKEGAIQAEKFTGDLGKVINKEIIGRENEEEIIFFKTVGIAAQDLLTAKAILNKAKERGIGEALSL